MPDLAHYLTAQAARRPFDTLKFASSELWRRGRMRFLNSIERNLPTHPGLKPDQAFAPFLSSASQRAQDFASHFPGAAADVIGIADAIARNEFEVFDTRYSPESNMDWQLDWVSGYRWPEASGAKTTLVSAAPGADIKRPWELARFHHALTLGQAFALSGNERYARAFKTQVISWILANPYPRGIHWAMPMEVGIRAANLCTAAAFFTDCTTLDRDFWAGLERMLFLHGRFLRLHREWNAVARGNHHLGCLAGLLFTGAAFRSLHEGRAWYEEAKHAITAEMEWQVGADGVAREGSSNYHGFVAEMFTACALLGARMEEPALASHDLPQAIAKVWGQPFRDRLARMFDLPAALLEGRERAPLLGDSDDGRFLPFCPNHTASLPTHLLALGNAIFGAHNSAHGHDCTQAWWLASEPAKVTTATRRSAPTAFREAGFYFLTSDRIRSSVRCGPLGVNGWANHAHGDQLHLEICVDGRAVLVDPGTYLYSGDPAARNEFRSSRAHNSPVVAAAEQNRFWPNLLFRIVDDTQSRVLVWEEDATIIRFAGLHAGYARLREKAMVTRQITLHRAHHTLIIEDRITGEGATSLEWNWQFAPGIALAPLAPHSAWRCGPVTLSSKFEAVAAPISAATPAVSPFDGWFAPRYGVRHRAPGMRFACRTALPIVATFCFSVDESQSIHSRGM